MNHNHKDELYQRVVVDGIDGGFILGHYANNETRHIKIALRNAPKENTADFSYLLKLVKKGAIINLIHPVEHDNILFPQYIILSPDFLVDISSIASCFEDYGNSAKSYLYNKLKPRISNSSIVLGNFASQLLDDELSLNPDENTYAQNVERFFKKNTISLLSTPLSADFHRQAKQQKANIHNILCEKLPEQRQQFDRHKILVEPSFFSEMLGLQGRMDFLQNDFSILIEQKSGKSRQLKHRVQMLLYLLLLSYCENETGKVSLNDITAYLLYSKFSDGLVEHQFDYSLVCDALRVRNEIVDLEERCATKELAALLSLSAEDFNTNHIDTYLWHQYQQPEIESFLSIIQNARPLEQKYYLRYLQFIAREHQIAKTGGSHISKGCFADKWRLSIEQKINDGSIFHNLVITYPTANTHETIEQVILTTANQIDADMTDFRKGDVVVLYPYRKHTAPDLRNKIVFRSTIEYIDDSKIRLSLRSTVSDSSLILQSPYYLWAIEHDLFESTSSSLYRGLYAFLSAPKDRRDLLLGVRKPQYDTSKQLASDYGEFNDLVLKAKQATDFFLIIGPPGTGKTSFGMLYSLCEELQSPSSHILIMAYTNRAVDEICSKLAEDDIDFLRLGSKASCEEKYHSHLLTERIAGCKDLSSVREIVHTSRIIVATTAAMSSNQLLQQLSFDLAIIDEASQILEPHIVGILSATNESDLSIKRFILIGDHKQLPAVVQQNREDSLITDKLLNEIGLYDCRESLFERLLRRNADNPHIVHMLTKQGRMHEMIAEFPNNMFYDGKLTVADRNRQCMPTTKNNGIYDLMSAACSNHRVAFINVPSNDNENHIITPDGKKIENKVNDREARIAAQLTFRIYEQQASEFNPASTIGIIVPYRSQIVAIRHYISQYNVEDLSNITIDTVERFQGSQRNFIIYSTTIAGQQGLEFLTDSQYSYHDKTVDRKLNVAITRARQHLIIVGNAAILSKDSIYSQLIDHIKSHQAYFTQD